MTDYSPLPNSAQSKTPILRSELFCHPDSTCTALTRLSVELQILPENSLQIRYLLCGDLSGLAIPSPSPAAQSDGLWEHTCFEAFVATDQEESYREFNFSPSGEWAAYAFSSYRERVFWLPENAPNIQVTRNDQNLELIAIIALGDVTSDLLKSSLSVNLTAVIEASDGSKSYWALRHVSTRPDFHDRDCFVTVPNSVELALSK